MGTQKKGASRGSEDPVELARVPLQAILLADSFTTKFRPITLERPKVSLSLSLNIYIIIYACIYIYVMSMSVCVCACVFMNVHMYMYIMLFCCNGYMGFRKNCAQFFFVLFSVIILEILN